MPVRPGGHTSMHRTIGFAVTAVSAAFVAAVLGPPGDAGAAAAHRPPPGTRLLLTFDNGESLQAGTMVRDTSGHHHPGQIIARKAAGLRAVKGWRLRGAGFPCRGCGHVIIEVADAPGLNPYVRPFVFGAAVRVGPKRAETGSNFMQKGRYFQTGGQYKLNLRPGGIPRCIVAGARGRVIVIGRRSIADGGWHRVSCLRTPTGLRLRVDG